MTKRKTVAAEGSTTTSVKGLLKLHSMQINQDMIDDNKSDNLSHALRDVVAKSPRNEREITRALNLGRPDHIQLELFEADQKQDFLNEPIA